MRPFVAAIAVLGLAGASPAHAQEARDTVQLATLQADAVRRDPRSAQIGILASQSILRLRNIASEKLPAIAVNAQAQHQSTVAALPVELPGIDIPRPPHDTYDASVVARQRLVDPTVRSRRAIERAQLAESQSRVRSSLFSLRQAVNDAYFQVLELQSQRKELEVVIADLEAQHAVALDRVREGAALPSEARMLEAELLRRRQTVRQLAASRDAALAILESLTGREIGQTTVLGMPDAAGSVRDARAAPDTLRMRPEFQQFASAREVITRQSAAIPARELPRVTAFARTGYGRPGLNPLASEFDGYWLAGVQLEWNPWTWGNTRRDRQVLSLQQQLVDTEQAAFVEAIRRATVRDIATIDRLESALGEDLKIVELREAVLREARARYREGVITSAEYVDRQTDVLSARVTLASHRIELAEARARFLTTLGLEVR